MTDPTAHEFLVCFSPAEKAALTEHSDELGISLEEYIHQSATSRALKRLEERQSTGHPGDVETTLSQLFEGPSPGAGHRAWADGALGNT